MTLALLAVPFSRIKNDDDNGHGVLQDKSGHQGHASPFTSTLPLACNLWPQLQPTYCPHTSTLSQLNKIFCVMCSSHNQCGTSIHGPL